MVARLELDKSKANDWNDQFKDSLKPKAPAPAQEQGSQLEQKQRRRGPRL